MTNYRRRRLPGGTYFFTVCLEDRAARTLVDHVDALRKAYAKTVSELPVICDAMVVLPNHLHAVWTLPEDDCDFSERWRRIKARFSHGLAPGGQLCKSKIDKRESGIWQRRFWEHCVRDDVGFHAAIEYCRQNPVRHGFVTAATDWPYSSFFRRENRMGRIAHPTGTPPGVSLPAAQPTDSSRIARS